MINIQTFILLTLIIYLISNNWFSISVFSKKTILINLLIKLFVGIFIFYYFSFVLNLDQNTDLLIYYNASVKIYSSLNEDLISTIKIIIGNNSDYSNVLQSISFWKRDFDYGIPNDNQTMIRIHLLLLLLIGKSVFNHLLFFILFSYTTNLILIKQLQNKGIPKNILLLFLFLPSILIWTSTTYKESIAISFHFLILSILLKTKLNGKDLIFIIIICTLHLFIKPFYLFFSLPFIAINIIYKRFYLKKWLNRTLISTILVISIFTSITINNTNIEKDEYKYGNKINILKMLQLKQDDFFYEAYHGKAKTILKLNKLEFEFNSFLTSLKDTFLNTFFSPSLIYPLKTISIPFVIENFILYSLIIYGLRKRKINIKTKNDKLLLLTGITLSLISGFITPVLGTLVKFKSLGYIYLFLFLIIKIFKPNTDKCINF